MSTLLGRPRIRTATLDPSVADQLLGAFGTSTNAYRQLSLLPGISFPQFRRAIEGLLISEQHARVIEQAWSRRRAEPVSSLTSEASQT